MRLRNMPRRRLLGAADGGAVVSLPPALLVWLLLLPAGLEAMLTLMLPWPSMTPPSVTCCAWPSGACGWGSGSALRVRISMRRLVGAPQADSSPVQQGDKAGTTRQHLVHAYKRCGRHAGCYGETNMPHAVAHVTSSSPHTDMTTDRFQHQNYRYYSMVGLPRSDSVICSGLAPVLEPVRVRPDSVKAPNVARTSRLNELLLWR